MQLAKSKTGFIKVFAVIAKTSREKRQSKRLFLTTITGVRDIRGFDFRIRRMGADQVGRELAAN